MKKVFSEEAVLFIAVAKWVILATIIGIIAGVSTGVFLKTLNLCISYGSKYPYSFLLLPFALFISASLTKYLAPEAEGHGTEKVIEAVHKNSGKISPLAVPVKLVSTVITIALGGSAGKEGPCAQIGGGLSSLFADIFRFSDTDRKKLVICGISAGFAAVFGTPIAGAIFGVEVLFVGSILYEVLLPSGSHRKICTWPYLVEKVSSAKHLSGKLFRTYCTYCISLNQVREGLCAFYPFRQFWDFL